jgi:hypothetical protein
MRLLQTVAFCLILIGLLRLTVANQSACRICKFLQRGSLNLTTAKISKYSAMIGLLRLDEASQSE